MRNQDTQTDFFGVLEPRILLSDDHADVPNYGDATQIGFISREGGPDTRTYFTAIGAYTGTIDTEDDTDLFSFSAPGDSPVSVMTVVQTDLGMLAPAMELRDAAGDVLLAADGSNGLAFLVPSFPLIKNQQYYVVAKAGTPSGSGESTATGRYLLFVGMDVYADEGSGGTGGGSGDQYERDDFGDRGDAPYPLFPSPYNADTTIAAGLQNPRDDDAFSFTVPAGGPVRLQVLSDDPDFDATITVLDSRGATRGVSTNALPGAKATVELGAIEGETLTVIVDSPSGAIGDYRLQVDATPSLYHYFYPAGFSSPTIEEFVPMVNPNDFEVNYAVIAHYETGDAEQLITTGSVAPHARGGITVTSARIPGSSLTRTGVPYAFEIVADGPIGANLGHYDFGTTTGEGFTDTLSTRWEFPEVRRAPDMRDFMVFYNPNPERATLQFTLLDGDGVMHRFTRTLDGQRRGGINFDTDVAIPGNGVYALWIDSDQPIVAAHTTYDVANGRGDGELGQPSAGARAGAFAGLSTEADTETRIALLNASGQTAMVRFRSSAVAGPIDITVPARTRLSLSPADLRLPVGVVASLTYTSDTPVTISSIQYRNGDGDASMAATQAATSAVIGAAWVNPRAKGTYIERLGVLNPGAKDADVTITFLFTDGSSDRTTFRLAGGDAETLAVDELEAIVRRGGPTAFSIRVDSATPVITTFSHYDLYLNGGWGSLAAPLGLTIPVEALMS